MTRKKALWVSGMLLVAVALVPPPGLAGSGEDDVAAVRTRIETAYINGAFNKLDTTAMREGFHPTFEIFGVKDGQLSPYPINTWIEGIDKRKAGENFNPEDYKWEHEFAMIDVTGVSAMAKVKLFKDGKHIFTDYLSLLKFEDGWQIVAKVYHKHQDY